MLLPLNLGPVHIAPHGSRPPAVEPLLHAAESGDDLGKAVIAATSDFGFDFFLYGITAAARPRQESRQYLWTTLPTKWMNEYDEKSYIEIDPCLTVFEDGATMLPFVWDQPTLRGKSDRLDQYLDDAARWGVCSGVSFGWKRAEHRVRTAVLYFISKAPANNAERMAQIDARLGDMMVWANFFHSLYMSHLLDASIPEIRPVTHGAKLSPREVEVLTLVARGIKTKAVAHKLDLSERMVQSHLDSIRSKMGVSNRESAIALAVARKLITP